MKTIIAGSRDIARYSVLLTALENIDWEITQVVSGTARGVDRLGELYAVKKRIPLKRFPANWGVHGRRAGPIRNIQMATYADALVAVWDGKSRGTKNMIDHAREKGLKVYVHMVYST